MEIDGILKMGRRMAARNNLYLFAWLCAIGLPLGLQLLSWVNEDVRIYLGNYFGVFSLYIYFTMTYGIATVFVGYYQTSSFRRAGTLDMLRISRMRPLEVLSGVFLSLEQVLIPPLLTAVLAMLGYLLVAGVDMGQARLGWFDVLGALLMQGLNQLVLCLLSLQGLLRNEAPFGLLAFMLVLPLNTLPVVLIYVLHLPQWVYLLTLLLGLAALMYSALLRVSRLWPPRMNATQ